MSWWYLSLGSNHQQPQDYRTLSFLMDHNAIQQDAVKAILIACHRMHSCQRSIIYWNRLPYHENTVDKRHDHLYHLSWAWRHQGQIYTVILYVCWSFQLSFSKLLGCLSLLLTSYLLVWGRTWCCDSLWSYCGEPKQDYLSLSLSIDCCYSYQRLIV